MSTELNCHRIETPEDKVLATEIRRIVFIVEQNVPPEREFDEYEEVAVHYLCTLGLGGEAVGTFRLQTASSHMDTPKDQMKVERFAVLKEARGQGVGKYMMEYIVELATSTGIQELVLGGQLQAIPFYEQFGFRTEGDTFMDAGIPHKMMWMKVMR